MKSLYLFLSVVLSVLQTIRAECTREGLFCGSSIGCESFFPLSSRSFQDLNIRSNGGTNDCPPQEHFLMCSPVFFLVSRTPNSYPFTKKDGNANFLYDCAAVGATPQFKEDCRKSASGVCRVVSFTTLSRVTWPMMPEQMRPLSWTLRCFSRTYIAYLESTFQKRLMLMDR